MLTSTVYQWKRCSLSAAIWSRRRKTLGLRRCCPLMLTAFKGPWDLGTAKGVRPTIDTGSAQPIQVPPRRVPFHGRQEMRSQVDEMLKAEIIELSDSPWSSLVVLVAKPDGSQHFCVDFLALNSVTKRDLYPLRRCDDILESGFLISTSLGDIGKLMWQKKIGKRWSCNSDGLYQFRKLSFGLTNEPACFMRGYAPYFEGIMLV